MDSKTPTRRVAPGKDKSGRFSDEITRSINRIAAADDGDDADNEDKNVVNGKSFLQRNWILITLLLILFVLLCMGVVYLYMDDQTMDGPRGLFASMHSRLMNRGSHENEEETDDDDDEEESDEEEDDDDEEPELKI